MATRTSKSVTNVGVAFRREELRNIMPQYDKIADCIAGEKAIKDAGDKYLPRPDATNTSSENLARYSAYVDRAVFYNATRRTLQGLLGEVFAVDPNIVIPPQMEVMRADANGEGVSLIQIANDSVSKVLSFSRAGIFVDYPAVETTTREQLDSGQVHPIIRVYDPRCIINWRTMTRGSEVILKMVVLEEDYDVEDGDFVIKRDKRWRVLKLADNGEYFVQVWNFKTQNATAPDQQFVPKDANGKPFKEIPFHFIGAIKNDVAMEQPLFEDLAVLNVAHYRNSADFEEASFVLGQPTYVFAGLTKDWVKNVLGGRVETGSRVAISLPVGGSGAILQPDPNTFPREGMEHKEKQMVALGAKIVENHVVQQTATETTMDQRTENSILSVAANNCSAVILWALQWSAKFLGIPSDEIVFKINTDFAIARLSPEDQQQLVSTWQANGITTEEMRAGLRNSGIATEPDKTALPKLKKQADEQSARKAKENAAKSTPVGTKAAVQPKARTPAKPK